MTNLIYLLGAGRSGTTLLATLLHSHPCILTLGEMHQFYEHLQDGKQCSCGKPFSSCPVWQPILKNLKMDQAEIDEAATITKSTERHVNIPKELLAKETNSAYLNFQEEIFNAIKKDNREAWFLDSSKYIARYLALKKSKTIQAKGIYLVRDVRGVVNSFQKKVQTPKKPLAAILYYCLINFWAQLVCMIDKKVLKIRYEDLTENPNDTMTKIYRHIFGEAVSVESLPDEFIMPHIVGGNRMKSVKKIKLEKDVAWKKKISKRQKVIYYILAFPWMLLNRYSP